MSQGKSVLILDNQSIDVDNPLETIHQTPKFDSCEVTHMQKISPCDESANSYADFKMKRRKWSTATSDRYTFHDLN